MIDIFFVAPIAPRGMAKGAAVINGHAAVFTDSESKQWQAQFAAIAAQHAPGAIFEGPMRVDILAVLPRPKKYMTRTFPAGLMWAPQKPDGDNIRKNVQDAMRAWWRDDKQVVAGQTVKCFAEKTGMPRTIVRVRPLDNVECATIVGPIFGEELVAQDASQIALPIIRDVALERAIAKDDDRDDSIADHQRRDNAVIAAGLGGAFEEDELDDLFGEAS